MASLAKEELTLAGGGRRGLLGSGHLLDQVVFDLVLDLTLQVKKHNLTVNLTTFRVWCYACEREVFLEQRLAVHMPNSSARLSEQVSSTELRLLVGNSVQMGQ